MTQSLRTYNRDVSEMISASIEDTENQAITIGEAQDYARVTGEELTFDMLISNAQDYFENYTGKLLFQRTVTCKFLSSGWDVIILPYNPVVSITSVQKDEEDVDYELYGDRLTVNTYGEIDIIYECGLFEDNVDSAVKLGLLKWIVSNYEDRQDTAAISVGKMPNGSMALWNKYKTYSL